MNGRIIRPGQKPPTPEQVRLAALTSEMTKLMNIHARLIAWCGHNLTNEQMKAAAEAMQQPMNPQDGQEIAEIIGVPNVSRVKSH